MKKYVVRIGKTLCPTELGKYIIDNIPVDELKSGELTGELERQLADIATGKGDYNAYIENIKKISSDWYSKIANSEDKKFVSESEQKMICPFCNSPLRRYEWGYGCTGYKEKGCKFSLNATIAGKKITENQVILLCQNRKTNLIKGFKSKSGSEFDAHLILKDDMTIGFEFEKKK